MTTLDFNGRSLKGLVAAGIFAASMALGGSAQAAIFGLSGVFDDDGLISGTFEFDQTCSGFCNASAYSNVDLTTTDGDDVQGAAYGNALFGSTRSSLTSFSAPSNALALVFANLKNLVLGDSIAFTGFEIGPEASFALFTTTTCRYHCDTPELDKRWIKYGKIEVIPLPAALPVLLTGLVALGGLSWRRRRGDTAA